MFKHYIILSSSYTQGERIALDFVNIGAEQGEKLVQLIQNIRYECGENVSASLYVVETDGAEWESVGRKNPFFKDVCLIENEQEFIDLIKADRELNGLDVAKLILSNRDIKCTHLKLEKLVYLCYAEYLCETQGKEQLFKDEIYAYQYGPVVKSVYSIYKKYGSDEISQREIPSRNYVLSARSRVLFSRGGLEKLQSITRTLEKYGKLTAGQLVDITHRKETPWAHCDSSKNNEHISDELILRFHCKEN